MDHDDVRDILKPSRRDPHLTETHSHNMANRRLLIINVVGLTPDGINTDRMPAIARFAAKRGIGRLTPPLPAVTCTSQATVTTGTMPAEHGIVSNGWYFRDMADIKFWCRSDRLVGGEKIWDALRRQRPDAKIANLFWRYCTHSNAQIAVTERPTYWADGRKGPDVFTEPAKLRDQLVEKLGDFPLFRFWGPATSIESTRWIADAALHVLASERPDLALVYLPHLDYDVQKFGPASEQSAEAHRAVDAEAGRLIAAAEEAGYEVAILSEYGMTEVSQPIYLNRVLREAGLIRVQKARNGELLEAAACRAVAAVSHQTAHIYVHDPSDLSRVRSLLEATEGVDQVLDREAMQHAGLAHARSGELFAIAAPGAWFAYPYWLDDANAPDFARCVAIHDKPGHDPMEMFFGEGAMNGKLHAMKRLAQKTLSIRAPFDVIGLDATRIRGSHGRLPDREEDHPVLLTSWPTERESPIAMTELKSLFLERLR